MKTAILLSLALLASPVIGRADPGFDTIVVAEQTVPGARINSPAPGHPAYYVAYDGGYIEAGAAIGGLKPPAVAAIGRALRSALGTAGYEAAQAQTVPSLVLFYHWGSIRHNYGQTDAFSNLEARLSLVAPARMVRQAEDFVLHGHDANVGYVASDLQSTLEFARGARYFVIVSAYDYSALTRHSVRLLWRVRLSTPENSGPMDEALLALVGSCGPYLGRNLEDRQRVSVLPPAPDSAGRDGDGTVAALPAPDATGRLNAGFIGDLVRQEHELFSGEPWVMNLDSRPLLPPALDERIAAYRQEKTKLQAVLAEKIKSRAPGEDIRRAIDVFKSEYSGRILALGQLRELIRNELAQLPAAESPPAEGQPLDVLLREFAIDVRHLQRPPSSDQ
jgi:hypothetical protein